jgi:hypothetical protein
VERANDRAAGTGVRSEDGVRVVVLASSEARELLFGRPGFERILRHRTLTLDAWARAVSDGRDAPSDPVGTSVGGMID